MKFFKGKKIYSLNEIKEKIKIEVLWNELIYLKYNNLVKIDKAEISSKINKLSNETKTEYLLSEIVFEKKRMSCNLINKINLSIKEIGLIILTFIVYLIVLNLVKK